MSTKQRGTPLAKSYSKIIANKPANGYILMIKIWKFINDQLTQFRSCFTRETTFKWFLLVIVGLMSRSDHLGVTSIIRELMLNPAQYNNLIHFFRSDAWKLERLQQKWLEIVLATGSIWHVSGMPILIGDGVSEPKEASRMPGVKKIHQESQDSTKSEYIRGQLFGGLGIMIGNVAKLFSLPLSMSIHDGNDAILEWKKSEYQGDSHVTRLVREACKTASAIGEKCWLLMDAYFLTGPALKAISEEAAKAGKDLVALVTRVKSNYTAWFKPDGANGAVAGKNGKPRLKDSFKIFDLFRTKAECFEEATLMLYGEQEKIKYYCVNLLWNRDLFQEIRFVLVNIEGAQSILACTDLLMDPCKIIELYCLRFKIETFFRAFKQVLSGFSCHFWTRRMPVFKPFAKAADMAATVQAVTADISRKSIVNTYDAIEGFVFFACIAMGLIQLCSLCFSDLINNNEKRWMRTNSNSVPSEETTSINLRFALPTLFNKCDDLAVVKAIKERQFELKAILNDGNKLADAV